MGNNIKRAHHYVWGYYLGAWGNDDTKQIYCYDKSLDKSYVTNINNTAKEKDFYQLNDLTIEDLFYIKCLACINQTQTIQPDTLKNSLSDWNKIYEKFFSIQQLSKFGKNSKELVEILNKFKNQAIEDLHCKLENIGIKYLRLIYDKNVSFFDAPDNKDKDEFLLYLSMQYVRTEKMKCNIRENMSKSGKNDITIQQAFGGLVNPISSTIDNHLNLILCNYAVSFSREISNHSIILLINDSGTNFVTSDQPVVNVDGFSVPITKLNFYYPVSPKLAILVSDNSTKKFNNPVQKCSDEEVTQYNDLMFVSSSKYIYSSEPHIPHKNCNILF